MPEAMISRMKPRDERLPVEKKHFLNTYNSLEELSTIFPGRLTSALHGMHNLVGNKGLIGEAFLVFYYKKQNSGESDRRIFNEVFGDMMKEKDIHKYVKAYELYEKLFIELYKAIISGKYKDIASIVNYEKHVTKEKADKLLSTQRDLYEKIKSDGEFLSSFLSFKKDLAKAWHEKSETLSDNYKTPNERKNLYLDATKRIRDEFAKTYDISGDFLYVLVGDMRDRSEKVQELNRRLDNIIYVKDAYQQLFDDLNLLIADDILGVDAIKVNIQEEAVKKVLEEGILKKIKKGIDSIDVDGFIFSLANNLSDSRLKGERFVFNFNEDFFRFFHD